MVRVEEKIRSGERLGFDDGLGLYGCADIWELGKWAEQATLDRVGDEVYYSINRHINYTNVCRINCGFCGFSRRLGEAGGYVMSVEEVVGEARKAYESGATEVHIVGGVHPELGFDYYVGMLEGIGEACEGLHVKAFTAVEIIDLAAKAGLSVEGVLGRLMEAGLGSMPGGGAEILSEEYFGKVCPNKPGPREWLKVHAAAHGLGLRTNATMLYGHVESVEERIEHLIKLRDLQDESIHKGKGRFQCFVPLPFIRPPGKEDEARGESDNVLVDLKTMAISRLMLDNFDHVKAFWPMLGAKLAQIALSFGANDLDGTVQQYRIVDKGEANSSDSMTVEEIRGMIGEAGRRAIQRDPFYEGIYRS